MSGVDDRTIVESSAELRSMLVNYSLQRSPTAYRLASGNTSHWYVAAKKTLARPRARNLLGSIVRMTLPTQIDAVGGMGVGGVVMSLAIADYLHNFCKRSLHTFYFADAHNSIIQGYCEERGRVIIVEDVVTTGRASARAVQMARDAGLHVDHVLALVDREDGGRQVLGEIGADLESLFTLRELIEHSQKSTGVA